MLPGRILVVRVMVIPPTRPLATKKPTVLTMANWSQEWGAERG